VAKASRDRILLLHVVNSETKDLMKREQLTLKNLYDKLRRLADSINTEHDVAADFEMEEGSIFTTIPEFAEKSKARLIIMGTHGIHGLQHIIGPNALRVSELNTVPDIIVQQRPSKPHGYKSIVVPIDSTKESKQKLSQTAAMASLFKGEVHLFAATESDEFLSAAVQRNVQFAQRMFDDHGIKTNLMYEQAGGLAYDKQILEYAFGIDADLIVIMTGDDRGLLDRFTGSEEEHIVYNAYQIPVMCIEPKDAQYGSVFTM
jgi:nucleotide-binding universal stress UspA family protein